ncbi:hypothetical protein [Terrimonas pollutisoli]|uniref:hypothetical protein n=1 Tax=Terrimonas pollutisoli TaxID=3034147 RepID=UPI0023ECC5FB|nr:hypothetical protein [Terrimonas sp. H1YJ31]
MKQKIFAIPYYPIIAIIILLASCKKGDTGSQGPAGPSGTANVFYTEWFNVDYNAETDSNGDTIRFFATIPAPRLVDSIIAKGEIKVYFNKSVPTQPDVVPLPYFDPIYFDPAVVLNPKFNPGLIYLSSNYNMGTFDEGAQKRYQYRYILIPGGTAGRAAPGGKTIDWNNYKEVQAYLGLKD